MTLQTLLRRIAPALLLVAGAQAQQSAAASADDSSVITLDRIYSSDFFDADVVRPIRWTEDGRGYYAFEPRARGKGGDLVRIDAATGAKSVLAPGRDLTPKGDTIPLAVRSFELSTDGKRLLIFTNTARVWRANTRGDYWVLDLATQHAAQARRHAGEAVDPHVRQVLARRRDRVGLRARERPLRRNALSDGAITRLTRDGSRTIINGTFDWVYEEEFGLRDGFRWSPDGKRIAYWQLDASGVRDFLLINDTDSLYSFTIPVQYPKAGTTNSAVRVGVVNADGGQDDAGSQVPGDPAQHLLARMEWAAQLERVVLQHLNRLQNTLRCCWATRRTGARCRSSSSRTAPGWTWWTTGAGSTAGSASPGSASGTAGATSTSCRATGQ